MARHVRGIGYSLRSSDAFQLQDLTRDLDEAEAHRVDFVELPLYQMRIIAGGRIIRPELDKLKALCAGRPFGYTIHGPLGINFLDEPQRLALHEEVLKLSLDISANLGASHYILHGGILDARDKDEMEARYGQQREALARFGEIAKAYGIIICVENLFTYTHTQIAALPSRLAQEIAAIGHPNIAACLDFSHGFINSTLHGADVLAETMALAPLARHLHIHDSFGKPQTFKTYSRAESMAFGLGDLHLPIGWGAIPWDAIMTGAAFPDGVILNLELPPPFWGELSPCIEALRRMAQQIEGARRAAMSAA